MYNELKKYYEQEALSDLCNALKEQGYAQLYSASILGIKNTLVFVSKFGNVVTIAKRNNDYILSYRAVKPMSKGGNKLEYRVTIEDRTYAIHKLVALTYPEITGKYSHNIEIHHLNGDHLDNDVNNLVCVTKEIHKMIHKLINNAKDKQAMHTKIYLYLMLNILQDTTPEIKEMEGFKNEVI